MNITEFIEYKRGGKPYWIGLIGRAGLVGKVPAPKTIFAVIVKNDDTRWKVELYNRTNVLSASQVIQPSLASAIQYAKNWAGKTL